MTVLDWVVILILAASVIRSLMRGLVEEVFSLGAWVVAFLAAKWGAAAAAPLLPFNFESEGLRYFVGFVIVFLVMMIVVMLVGHMIKGAVGAIGLGSVDKVVGGLFGLLRGMVMLVGFTLAAGLTAFPQTDFWKNSFFTGPLERMAIAIQPLLPASLAKHVHF